MSPRVVCLLPVRNAARDLPGFFASVSKFADAVVALNDGSTDETAELLRANPLVVRMLSNPPREGFAGWDDAANRNALLAAVSDLQPEWILSIDADERISPDDASDLTAFLRDDALPGIAYGFRCYSMIGEEGQTLPNPIWVYRLFAYQHGQRFPDQALHFAPIPTSISRQAFLRTTFRIQHLGGMSRERRLARYEKYRQADPECRFWPDYSSLLNEPKIDELAEWSPRKPGSPVLYSRDLDTGSAIQSPSLQGGDAHELGIVLIDDGSPESAERTSAMLTKLAGKSAIQVLVVTDRPQHFKSGEQTVWITVPESAGRSARKNAGLARTTASNVLFLESDLSLLPESSDAICDAHRAGYAVVTGQILVSQGVDLSSAALQRRFGTMLDASDRGITAETPRWASYRTSLLRDLGGWDESLASGAETLLALKLESRGYLAFSVGLPVVTVSPSSARPHLDSLRFSFEQGVAKARFQLSEFRDQGELLELGLVRQKISKKQEPRPVSSPIKAGLPKTHELLLDVTASAGELLELFKPQKNKALTLFARPAGIALVVVRTLGRKPLIALVRFDLAHRMVKVALLPDGLNVPSAAGDPIDLQQAFDLSSARPVDRFTAHDLIGRPFQIELDDIIEIDKSDLRPELRTAFDSLGSQSLESELPAFLSLTRIRSLVQAASSGQGVRSSMSPRALAFDLLRIRALRQGEMAVVELPVTGSLLDSDTVQMARTFLDADSIVRPATRRNRLRLVEWA